MSANSSHDIDSLWNYNDPAGSEARFRKLLPEAEAGTDHAHLAELLTQIARAQGLQRHFDDAHRTLDRVEAMLTAHMTRAKVRYLLERGRVFNSSGDTAQAIPLFMAAWESATAAGEDYYAVDAAHMIAITEKGDAVMEWNMKALTYAESSSQTRARNWLGSLYNNIGWTYFDVGDYTSALEIFHKALANREEGGHAEQIRIARWCIGRVLRALNRIDEALALQQDLLATYGAEADGYVHEEIAECLLLLGKDAASHFARAYAVLSQDRFLVENESERLARLKRLGNIN